MSDDEPTVIGPHLLGRKPNPPDPRDWSPRKLHDSLLVRSISDTDLDQTLRETSKQITSWRDMLALASSWWTWIKHQKPGPPPPPAAVNLWDDPTVLDQGNTGTCVGNAGAGWLASDPIMDAGVDETLARALYREASCYDGQCDDTYKEGTTSRSLAKALKARGRLSAYAFAYTMADIDEWLAGHGTVMIGLDWYFDMFKPDKDFVVHPTGGVAGGHEVLIRYREPGTTRYRCRNSWGTGWGDHGDFLIEASDLERLLFQQGGDALLAAELPIP